MRGIIFTGGLQPDQTFLKSWIAPYSFVIAADSGLVASERSGIEADLVLGDMDSLGDLSLLEKYPPEKKQLWPVDKDYSDTEIALVAMKERGIDDVVLVGGDGGRMDHFFALRSLFDRIGPVPSMWIGRESAVIAFGSGTVSDSVIVTGLASDDPVSVFAAGSGEHLCRGTGFHWPIDSLDWDSLAGSLSNRTDTGSLTVTSDSGRFLLVVPFCENVSVKRPVV